MDKVSRIKYAMEQLIGQGNTDVVEEVFASDYIAHAGDRVHKGHNFVKHFSQQVRSAIPDIEILNIEILSQSEKTITWQRTFSGTHKIAMRGIPASNKEVKWYEIVVTRFEGEKIVEEWVSSDLAGQLLLKLSNKK